MPDEKDKYWLELYDKISCIHADVQTLRAQLTEPGGVTERVAKIEERERTRDSFIYKMVGGILILAFLIPYLIKQLD